jgi:hypothetical protein
MEQLPDGVHHLELSTFTGILCGRYEQIAIIDCAYAARTRRPKNKTTTLTQSTADTMDQ